MALYAHAVIEDGDTKYQRGDTVPDSLGGLDELRANGAVSDQPYDPDAEPTQTPEVVEIDGVRYVKASDDADTAGASRGD